MKLSVLLAYRYANIWVIVVTLLLSGCSYQGLSREQIDKKPPLPVSVDLDGTPFFPQERYQCGAAALATVLNESGIDTNPEELTPYVYLPGRKGSLRVDIVATARRFKRLPYELEGSLTAVFTELASGKPVLVMQNLGFSWFPQWHYAVIIGYDLNQNTVTLRSGKERRHVIPIYTFDKTWERAGRWALITAKPDQIPVTAGASSYARVVHDIGKLYPDVAISAYQKAVNQWQHEPLLWLALGNLFYQQKQFQRSVDTFSEGLTYHPYNVQLWNNYAYGLSAQGCLAASLAAIDCAVQIKPRNFALRQSLLELGDTKVSALQHCEVLSCPEINTANQTDG